MLKKSNLPVYYSEYQEINPCDYTDKLQTVIILDTKQHYESWYNKKTNKSGKMNFTYVYYKTKEDTFYPARNGGFLDGLVGCMKLRKFNTTFKLIK